ncbi:methyl-accepting chemotaxis protein [Delftia lacustris]|jgi:methyl-accepting chemotaxis protein|uniref:methyl-accepting chemotaxis protein n=1 Tax=Delftia TaxID=80865 RepID=UPI001FCB7D95|nr:methyl-accepting chemotaxis protein [Delftia lacustris]BDE75039.1 methyl-accepting chemotaxis protein [Delftia lacustris]
MNPRFWTVKTKFSVAFSSLALLTMVVALLALQALSEANQNLVHFVDGINARATLAEKVRTAVDRRAIAVRNLVLVTSPADLEKEKGALTSAHADVKAWLTELQAAAESTEAAADARNLVTRIADVERRYGPVATDIVALALQNKKDVAIRKMNDECRPLLAELTDTTRQYSELTRARSRQMIEQAAQAYVYRRNMLIAASMVAIFLAVLMGWRIARGLTRSLGAEPAQLGNVAQQIAQGNLSPELLRHQAPEGSVQASLNAMLQSLASVVHEVRKNADGIAGGSTEIANGNADLSQRTEQQASALQETAASMEQLSTTVRQNADNARQVNQLALGASQVATKGGGSVQEVVNAMQDISESSRQIGEIVGVIDGIAFQTNILALNAAVEAARAGEQGKGFAVVAGEVRNLAQRSAQAAREIKQLIATSTTRVKQGTELADQAGATMAQVLQSIQRVTDLMGEISSASDEQSAGVAQVGKAVSQMDQVTQQNAALVEESAAAAASLRTQAQQLVQAVSIFQLGGQAAQPASTPPLSQPTVQARNPAPAKAALPARQAARPVLRPVSPAHKQAQAQEQDDWVSF